MAVKISEKTLKNFKHYWKYHGSKLEGTTEEIARKAYINGHQHAFRAGYEHRYWHERDLERRAKNEIDHKHRIEQQLEVTKHERATH